MFKSKIRPILFPQSEHLKLAGALAWLWGNDQFEFPPAPRLSVVTGIALHDRAYGYLDNVSIGEVADEPWLALTRRGFFMPCADPLADLVARHHLLRLVSGTDTPAHQALADDMRQAIQQQAAQNGLDLYLFQQIDRLTALCDFMAFDFCFEAPAQRQMEVFTRYASGERATVNCRVEAGEIVLDPWPLRVERYEGCLVGYQVEGYPDRLDGMLAPYVVRPA